MISEIGFISIAKITWFYRVGCSDTLPVLWLEGLVFMG